MCFCDPLMPAFLTQTADQQRYDPEWMAATLGPTDQLLRYSKPDQWAHAISNVGAFPPKEKNEAYQAFKLADPNGEPKEEFYSTAYALVLELFNGLQAAGPDGSPPAPSSSACSACRRRAPGSSAPGPTAPAPSRRASTPSSGGGATAATSAFDGRPGRLASCNGGAYFPYATDRRAEWGPPGSPLDCFR